MEPDLAASSYGDHLVELLDLRHVSELVHQEVDVSRKGKILPGRRKLDQGLVNTQDEQGGQSVTGVLLIRDL